MLARIVARLDESFVYQAENLSPRKRWDSAERKKSCVFEQLTEQWTEIISERVFAISLILFKEEESLKVSFLSSQHKNEYK